MYEELLKDVLGEAVVLVSSAYLDTRIGSSRIEHKRGYSWGEYSLLRPGPIEEMCEMSLWNFLCIRNGCHTAVILSTGEG